MVLSKITSEQSLIKDGVRTNMADDLKQSYLVLVKSQMKHEGKPEKFRARASTEMRQHTSLGLPIPKRR